MNSIKSNTYKLAVNCSWQVFAVAVFFFLVIYTNLEHHCDRCFFFPWNIQHQCDRFVFVFFFIPPEYGGMGLDFSYSIAVAEELGSIRCGGIPMAIGVQAGMATPALTR